MIASDDTPLLTNKQTIRWTYEENDTMDIDRRHHREVFDTSKTNIESSRSDHEMSVSDKKTSIWRDTNTRQKTIILYITIVNFLSFLCISSASPFLARIAIQKGGTVVFSTIILQVSMVTMAIFSLIFGKYQRIFGGKRLIVFGQIAFAITQITFGSIGYIDAPWAVVTVGVSLRALSGVFQAAFNVAGLTIVCREFPDFVSIVFGLFEAAYGAGAYVGPYLGGFLYDWSGNTLVPMAVSGGATLLSSTLGFIILRESPYNVKQSKSDNSDLSRILSDPRAILIIGAAVTVAGSLFVCDATITLYLEDEGFSATGVGQLLFLIGVAYTVVAAIAGFIVSRRKCLRRFVFLSGLVGSFAFPLMFIPGQTNGWIYGGAFGYAMSGALAFIPSFDELMCAVNRDESTAEVDDSMSSSLSGLWNSAVSLSDFILPLIGSAMETRLPFYISLSASILIGYGTTVMMAMLMFLYRSVTRLKMSS